MINKKLLSFDRKALHYVGLNVLFQWLGMLCNVVLVMTVSRLIGGVFAGSLTGNALWQGMLLCLLTVPVRYGLTLCASDMSDRASKDVKRTLRSSIYAKLTRLGAGYSETVATSEAVMLASEGVEQIDTYFAKYLPQLFYSLLAPVTLFVLLVGVHARSAILLLCCVPLIPLSIVAVQKFAKKLLANYWGEYTTLGDSFLENIQGLTTLKIYQADGWKHEEMNAQAERFRKITMKVLTMQLNSVTLMDLMPTAVRVWHHQRGIGLAKGQLSLTSALTILLLAADFFLPLRLLGSYFHIAMNGAASAEKIFRLLSARSLKMAKRLPTRPTAPLRWSVSLLVTRRSAPSARCVPDHPAGQLCLAGGRKRLRQEHHSGHPVRCPHGDGGRVTLGGIPVSEWKQADRLRLLTLVPHNAAIFKGTVEANLRMARPDAAEAELWAALEQVNLAEFCRSQSGLATELHEAAPTCPAGSASALPWPVPAA